jgi:hypothetical protein
MMAIIMNIAHTQQQCAQAQPEHLIFSKQRQKDASFASLEQIEPLLKY